jgi:hypothetical protein
MAKTKYKPYSALKGDMLGFLLGVQGPIASDGDSLWFGTVAGWGHAVA